jgi:hypothetical protein
MSVWDDSMGYVDVGRGGCKERNGRTTMMKRPDDRNPQQEAVSTVGEHWIKFLAWPISG